MIFTTPEPDPAVIFRAGLLTVRHSPGEDVVIMVDNVAIALSDEDVGQLWRALLRTRSGQPLPRAPLVIVPGECESQKANML